MKYYKIATISIFSFLIAISSCVKDLDTVPLDKDLQVSELIFKDAEVYRQFIAKLYAGFATTGQEGPSGNADILGIDEGFSQYLRIFWKAQEFTTDEALTAWINDEGLFDLHFHNWTSSNQFTEAFYYRIMYQLTLAGEFIREASDEKLDFRGITGDLKAEIQEYKAEARFLRALVYWHALDMYGRIPFITDEDAIGSILPKQVTYKEYFEFIEDELKAIEDQLASPPHYEYGRADQAAAWMLLAKLYLNAEVYIGESRYSECMTYVNKVISSGYSIHPEYDELFMADNNETCTDEIIFPIVFDGLRVQTWGGTTLIIHGAIGGTMDGPGDFGVSGGWNGHRATSAFVEKFFYGGTDVNYADGRAMFHTDGQTLEITEVSDDFTQGYAVAKFSNMTSTGNPGSHEDYTDTDFPMFRLADAYLIYAEAHLRGGGGDAGTAVGYINELRQRAFGDASGNITTGDLTLDFVLDERARELYWEGHRRTDLRRYGLFTSGNYLWPWKGNIDNGISTDEKYNLFPIPASDLIANPELEQNPGY